MNKVFFFLLAMLMLLLTTTGHDRAFAGQVTRIYQKRGVVKVNEGSKAGFEKGTKVCIFSPAGKRVACGQVKRATSSSAFVGIAKSRLKRVKKGYEVSTSSPKSKEVVSGNLVSADRGIDHRTNFKLGYLFTALAPTTYNKLNYNAPANQDETVDSLWVSEGTTSNALIGLIAEGEFGVGKDMAVSVGLRYRSFREFIASSDYNSETSLLSKYVEISQTGVAMGLYSDFTYLDIAFTDSLRFRMNSGLDVDQSTVKFEAKQKDDDAAENATIASYSSSLMTLSLRLGMNLNFLMAGPFGVSFGITGLVPAATFGKSASSDVKDPQAETNYAGGSDKAGGDLTEAIGHTKSSFGLEVVFATFIAF